jgi:methionine--tRNA ligase beta chain
MENETEKTFISIDDVKKVEMTAGKIISVEKIPNTDKLLKLMVDFAEEKPRQIVSGIALSYPNEQELVGKKCMFITNLQPRTIKGHESNGMILALSTQDANGVTTAFSLLEPHPDIPQGTKAK